MPADHRTILYRSEWDALLREPPDLRGYFGAGYADVLLDSIYRTDARRLAALFPTWTLGQQTLYGLNAFVGEVTNGGVSQFLFNPCRVLRYDVLEAMRRVGDDELAARYARELERYERAERDLNARRANASRAGEAEGFEGFWAGFKDFQRRLDATGAAEQPFNDWFFAGREAELDRRTRQWVGEHRDAFAVLCDDSRPLQRLKARRAAAALADAALHRLRFPMLSADALFSPASRPPGATTGGDEWARRILADRRRLLLLARRGLARLSVEERDGRLTARISDWVSRRSIVIENQEGCWNVVGWS